MKDLKLYDIIANGGDKMDVDYESVEVWRKLGFLKNLDKETADEVCAVYSQVSYEQLMEELDTNHDKRVTPNVLFPFFVARNAVCLKKALEHLVSNPVALTKLANEYTKNNSVNWDNSVNESLSFLFQTMMKSLPKAEK